MRTTLQALGLLGAGFGLASVLLALTRPPPTPPALCPHHASTSVAMSTAALEPKARAFWEVGEHHPLAVTPAAMGSAAHTLQAQDFMSPAQTVPSPLQPVMYLTEPQRFVQTFQDCEDDPHCHVTYLHVPKTGGTTMEAALSQVFHQPPESSCCGSYLLDLFRQNPDHYCNSKYTSWQVDYPVYFEVLETCFRRDVKKKRRVLMLISFREVRSKK